MRFSQEKIEEIRAATDIVDVVGTYVKLKKRGKNFVGLCPFHTEKTPSFNVSPERQMYHCFGCGVGGNVFTFLMELEKVSFPEALRSFAQRAGIALEYSEGQSPDDGAVSESQALYDACSMAARFFYTNLNETTQGRLALEYFRHRGFSDESIKKFGLGYALSGWDSLIKYAESKGVSVDILVKAGLAHKREEVQSGEQAGRGGYYDYFRGRAMFPIFSTTGRVVGFGARKLREDDPLGKYINSPETRIYNKSRMLYGIYHAKDAIREKDTAVLVEGYADLITAYQAGIHNVVASSGTALTSEQVQLLGRYARNITIVYDADSAGSKAALRGVDLILENDLDVRIARLPAGEDPDSFIKRQGGAAFEDVLLGSTSFVDFIARSYEKEGKFSTPEGQAEAVRAIVQTIAKMRDELKRHFYVKHVADSYDVYETVLLRELELYLPRARRGARPGSSGQVIPVLEREVGEPPGAIPGLLPAAERDILHAMLEGGGEVLQLVFQQISVEDFSDPRSRALASHMKDRWDAEGKLDSSGLINEIEDDRLRRLVAELLFSKYELSKGWKGSGVDVSQADPREIAREALTAFRRRALTRHMEENQRQIKEASERGEDVVPLLARRLQLLEEMKTLNQGTAQPS